MNSTSDSPQVPLVSIVVPVFNVAPYLKEGLESLLRQEFPGHYEVILIDDCSTDESLSICREFATRHADVFQLIESAGNAGVSIARNKGLDRASGRYLIFFDPDDILPAGALETLCQAAETHSADIVKGNLVLFDDSSRRAAPDQVNHTRLVTGARVLTTLYEHSQVRGHIGGKLFRRDKFADLRFTVGVRMAQDLLFFSQLFARADSLLLLAQDVYDYRKHPHGSTGGKYRRGSYVDWLSSVEQSGQFASTPEQERAHRGLMLRTLAQIARECRKIPAQDAAEVLPVIEDKINLWKLRYTDLLKTGKPGLRDFGRYVKLRLALRQIRRNLARS